MTRPPLIPVVFTTLGQSCLQGLSDFGVPFVRSVPAPGTLRQLVPYRQQAGRLAVRTEGLTKCNGIPCQSQNKMEQSRKTWSATVRDSESNVGHTRSCTGPARQQHSLTKKTKESQTKSPHEQGDLHWLMLYSKAKAQ